MLIWSIVPADLLWQGFEEPPKREEIVWQGKTVQVLVDEKGQKIIERLYSSDPADFLQKNWQPGQKIFWQQK